MKNTKSILILILSLIGAIILIAAIYNLTDKEEKNLTEKNSIPVYFFKTYGENDFKLTPVRRKIYKNESKFKIALSELLRGPTENEKKLGYFSEIPKETKLIEIKGTSERIIINLSQEFEIGGGSSSMSSRLEQIINTALDSVDKKPVYLEIEGEQVKYFGGEGVMVPQPLSRNLNKGQNI